MKKQDTTLSSFIGFKVPKYIASKSNENVIFEFVRDGKTQRKWINKSEIVLLTDNKEFYLKTMKQFQDVESVQQKLVDNAKKELDKSIELFSETVNKEIDEFTSNNKNCILHDL